MKWLVETKGETLTLTAKDLVGSLLGKLSSSREEEFDELIGEIAKHIKGNPETWMKMSPVDYLQLGLALGYRYHVFLTKNKVKIDV
jgi:hypothetical protein